MGKSINRKPLVKKTTPAVDRKKSPAEDRGRVSNPKENIFRERLSPAPLAVAPAEEGKKSASVTVIPVRAVHITEVDVNGTAMLRDANAAIDEKITGTGSVFPSRPVSLYLHFTGLPNTLVAVELIIDAVTEYKEDVYIPESGNLVMQKNIA